MGGSPISGKQEEKTSKFHDLSTHRESLHGPDGRRWGLSSIHRKHLIFNDVFEFENPSLPHLLFLLIVMVFAINPKLRMFLLFLIRVSLILFVYKRHGGMIILLILLLKINGREKYILLILTKLTQSIGVWVSPFYSDVILIAMSYLLKNWWKEGFLNSK